MPIPQLLCPQLPNIWIGAMAASRLSLENGSSADYPQILQRDALGTVAPGQAWTNIEGLPGWQSSQPRCWSIQARSIIQPG